MSKDALWKQLGVPFLLDLAKELVSRYMSGKMSDEALRAYLSKETALELRKRKQDILAKQKLGDK